MLKRTDIFLIKNLAPQKLSRIFNQIKKYKHMKNQNIADSVIKIFFEVGIDGETMEYIIDKMGMRDQMIKQLTPQDDIVELERGETIMVSFTRQQLIEYTREIQERCKSAATEAVKNAGIDFEYMVELELEYDKTITVSFDEGALYREIESLIDDTFETDDDSVFDEATNVITFMSKR
jgi:hypothetical protein